MNLPVSYQCVIDHIASCGTCTTSQIAHLTARFNNTADRCNRGGGQFASNLNVGAAVVPPAVFALGEDQPVILQGLVDERVLGILNDEGIFIVSHLAERIDRITEIKGIGAATAVSLRKVVDDHA